MLFHTIFKYKLEYKNRILYTLFKNYFEYGDDEMAKETAFCNVTCLHEDKVNRVKENLSDEHLHDVTKLLKAVADQTRIKIISALSIEEELCVCDVANILDCSIATTSHHLRTLKKAGLTSTRKEGKTVYYKLSDHYMAGFILQAISQQKEIAL